MYTNTRRSGGSGQRMNSVRGPRTTNHGSGSPRTSSGPFRRTSRPSGAGFAPQRGGKRRGGGEHIDPARFIRRADAPQAEEAFVPRFTYGELPLAPDLKRAIELKGYNTPTPIQDGAIPHILLGKDVVGIANTGTGKTAAFLVPLIEKVRTVRGEQVLVVVPTRELAIQIEDELRALTRGLRVYSVCAVGGVSIGPQLRALRQRNEFVIGTPGRLKDLIDRGALRLSAFRTIVLDEADRMLDMGFIGDMRYLMERMESPRQTLFFSATLSPEIRKLIGEFLTEPVHISVKTGDTSKNVDQDVVRIRPGQEKTAVLHGLLSASDFEKVLVFGRTKHGVERLAKDLVKRGIRAESIHGNKNHNGRQRALQAFHRGQVQVLVATDVAARGLDIPRVTHVINFDLPATYEDYVHRIGRTGRADRTGKALTFIEGR